MQTIKFFFYYLAKFLSVKLGLHQTDNPLNWNWRRKYWQKSQESKQRRIHAENKKKHSYPKKRKESF